MRKAALATLAATMMLAGGMLGIHAQAMPLTMPSVLGVAAADTALVHKATNVCGANGCVRVQTARVQHRRRPVMMHR